MENRQFIEEETQMSSRHGTRCPDSLVTKKVHIKTAEMPFLTQPSEVEPLAMAGGGVAGGGEQSGEIW